MKIVPTLLIVCFLAVGIFLMGIGCNNNPPPPSKLKQWESWVDSLKSRDYNVRSVNESQLWLAERPEILTSDIDFLTEKHVVAEGSIITIITRDHNGNLRVVTKEWPGPLPDPWAGFMTTERSIQWLEAQGYQVKKNNEGYILKKDVIENRGGIDIDISERRQIGWGSTIVLDTGTIIQTVSGEIRIKPKQ